MPPIRMNRPTSAMLPISSLTAAGCYSEGRSRLLCTSGPIMVFQTPCTGHCGPLLSGRVVIDHRRTEGPERSSVRLLVTGGAGYIGSVVAVHLLEAGHQVTVVDDLSTGHADAVPAGATFIKAGIDQIGPLLAEGFDGVLHFAAKSLVGESVEHPERYWHNNVAGTLALLEAMRVTRTRRIVFSSTA